MIIFLKYILKSFKNKYEIDKFEVIKGYKILIITRKIKIKKLCPSS